MTDLMELADTYADRFHIDRRHHDSESGYDRAASRLALQSAIEALQAERDQLKAELDDPFRLARHSKRLVEQLRADNEKLKAETERLLLVHGDPAGSLDKCMQAIADRDTPIAQLAKARVLLKSVRDGLDSIYCEMDAWLEAK